MKECFDLGVEMLMGIFDFPFKTSQVFLKHFNINLSSVSEQKENSKKLTKISRKKNINKIH